MLRKLMITRGYSLFVAMLFFHFWVQDSVRYTLVQLHAKAVERHGNQVVLPYREDQIHQLLLIQMFHQPLPRRI